MQTITVIVETPKGSNAKFNYDAHYNAYKLKKLLPQGMVFPFDFGFIPGTKAEDGDPLDVMVISEIKSFPGCVMDCRLIGALAANQTEKNKTFRNDRLFAVPLASKQYENTRLLKQLPKKILNELEHFFINYNEMEGKKFKPLQYLNAQQAQKLIKYI